MIDTSDARVDEGLRIALAAIRRMAEQCAGVCEVAVVAIPTKERVFAELLYASAAAVPRAFAELTLRENLVWERVRRELDEAGIPLVDAMPQLRALLASGRNPYLGDWNGHPDAAGNAAIAEAVLESGVLRDAPRGDRRLTRPRRAGKLARVMTRDERRSRRSASRRGCACASPRRPSCRETRELLRRQRLGTVCEEAACPNLHECWSQRHATVMVLGTVCTRACAFCNVATGLPGARRRRRARRGSPSAVAELGLRHVVVTSVDRDDLADGGAGALRRVHRGDPRALRPRTTIEILTPDFRHKPGAIERGRRRAPDVYNHNVETVPRLYRRIRPGASFAHSLRLLARVKEVAPATFTKSGHDGRARRGARRGARA